MSIYSDPLEFPKNSHQTVLFLENYLVRTPVPSTVFFKIFNMFDRIELIQHYIFFT